MTYTHLFLLEAQKEYETALYWYLERSTKAAKNFVIAFENALILVCTNPQRWRNGYENYFELRLKKYPFTIVYLIDDQNHLILITAVFHHSKDPIDKYRL